MLIGSDSPTLPADYIQQAFERLQQHDAVLGPTEDGGYYLIGIRDAVPPVFDGVQWGSPQVWRQTVDRLHESKVRFATLPTWYDVDVLDDLERLQAELRDSGDAGDVWGALKAAVDEVLQD